MEKPVAGSLRLQYLNFHGKYFSLKMRIQNFFKLFLSNKKQIDNHTLMPDMVH